MLLAGRRNVPLSHVSMAYLCANFRWNLARLASRPTRPLAVAQIAVRSSRTFCASSPNDVPPHRSKSIAEQNEERARQYLQKYASQRDTLLISQGAILPEVPKKHIPEVTGKIPDVDIIATRLEDEHGAHGVMKLDVRAKAPFADWLVLCCGRTQRHVLAIADGIKDDMRRAGIRIGGDVVGICGRDDPQWMAVDVGPVVVHVMTDGAREQYDLEGLWIPDQVPDDPDDEQRDKVEN